MQSKLVLKDKMVLYYDTKFKKNKYVSIESIHKIW
jgi:hypothetical protein